MSRPLQATLAGCVLALVALSAIRGCASADHAPVLDGMATAPHQVTGTGQAAGGGAAADAQAMTERRDASLRSAVSTLHRYLAALGGDDRAAADAFWADGRAPASSGEADLRQLTALRALRSHNGTPLALDGSAVPDALEIPVDLRASVQGQPLRLYAGSYRLRRRVADGGWEITSAAIDRQDR